MKAAVTTKYGSPEVVQIQDVPIPTIKPNEVLVKVMAAAVNSGDVRIRGLRAGGLLPYMMKFIFGWKKPGNGIQGLMFSGIIEAIGSEVGNWKIGDEVCGSTGMKMGAHAAYLKIQANKTIHSKPKNASFEEAAAIIFGGTSALYFLQKAGIEKIEKPNVLIYGATGSVGTSAIEIAKHYDATVTAVCSERGAALAKSLGADKIIDYTKEDFRKLDTQFDIVFDAVGKISKKDAQAILKPTGKFCTVGGMDVAKETGGQIALLKKLFEAGELHANIDRTYTLEEIVEAHTYVDSERKKGNVVIKLNYHIS